MSIQASALSLLTHTRTRTRTHVHVDYPLFCSVEPHLGHCFSASRCLLVTEDTRGHNVNWTVFGFSEPSKGGPWFSIWVSKVLVWARSLSVYCIIYKETGTVLWGSGSLDEVGLARGRGSAHNTCRHRGVSQLDAGGGGGRHSTLTRKSEGWTAESHNGLWVLTDSPSHGEM